MPHKRYEYRFFGDTFPLGHCPYRWGFYDRGLHNQGSYLDALGYYCIGTHEQTQCPSHRPQLKRKSVPR